MIFMVAGAMITFSDFAEMLRRGASKNVDILDLLKISLMRVPHLMDQLLPFIVLFTTIFTFWHLKRKNEIDVIQSTGVSYLQLLLPLLASGLFMGGVNIVFLNPGVAKLTKLAKNLENKLLFQNQGNLAVTNEGIWIRESKLNGITFFHMDKLNVSQNSGSHIKIYELGPDFQLRKEIHGKTFKTQKGGVVINDVTLIQNNKVLYKKSLRYKTHISIEVLSQNFQPPDTVSFQEIPRTIKTLSRAGFSTKGYVMNWHIHLTQFLWFVSMIIFGAAGVLKTLPRHGSIMLVVMSVGISLVLFLVRDISYAMGEAEKISPFVAAWAPACISGMFGMSAFLHFEEK